MSHCKLHFISGDQVKQSFQMPEAIDTMGQAFQHLSNNNLIVPPRIHIDMKDDDGIALVMPAYSPSHKEFTIKAISIFGKNYQAGLPLINALVLVFDASTGCPVAVIDGTSLTAIRTGAASGFATKILAKESAETVAIFGAGLQGETQLEAICAVKPISKALIYDLDQDRASKFACEMSKRLSIEIQDSPTAQDLKEADIICTATTSSKPVFDDVNLKDGVHINAIGAFKPHVHEIPVETVVRARVVVDHLESCLTEAGDLIIPLNEGLITKDHIICEIGEMDDKCPTVRENESDITFFKTVGNAVEDLYAASVILKNARKYNIGTQLSL
jgi:ornithine cyclodeaminase/alanine dehydrogenase-like protein (mu-crystallin family)